MARYVVDRRRHHPIRNLLVVILLALVAYVACAGYSVMRIYGDVRDAQSAYQHAESSLGSGDVTSAIADVRSLSTAAADIGDQADFWVWPVGEHVPWIGEDVTVARGLAHVSDSLCNDALLPVVEQYEGATSGAGSASGAADALTSAATAVTSCQQQLDGLGTSHFSQLNAAKDELAQAVSAVGGGLGGLSSAISALGALGGVASSLAG